MLVPQLLFNIVDQQWTSDIFLHPYNPPFDFEIFLIFLFVSFSLYWCSTDTDSEMSVEPFAYIYTHQNSQIRYIFGYYCHFYQWDCKHYF